MKLHPNHVCYKVFRRYMSPSEKADFDKLIIQFKNTRHKYYFNAMIKHFDIEKLRKQPLIWQDIWLYNYIIFETSERLRRDGMFKMYVREAFIYEDEEFFDYVKNMPPSDKAKVSAVWDYHSTQSTKE
jgi:hypothetical protein